MKRVVVSASRPNILSTIQQKFIAAGCNKVTLRKATNSYAELDLVLPSGKHTSVTVWYNYRTRKEPKDEMQSTVEPYSKDYKIDDDGNVVDADGAVIGFVEIHIYTNKNKQRHIKEFDERSVRSNLGDIDIRDLQSDDDYKVAINMLERRSVKNSRRST